MSFYTLTHLAKSQQMAHDREREWACQNHGSDGASLFLALAGFAGLSILGVLAFFVN